MKQQLQQIYGELASGKLSQSAALERIRALKRAPAVSSLGTLFACPVWRPSSVGVGSGGYGEGHVERHVVLCAVDGVDLPDLESRLLSVRCVRLDAGAAASDDLAGRYSGYALSCFGYVRDVLLGRPGGPVLVQVVVGGEDAGVLSSLSGLLRTAGLENPLFHGQLVVAGSATTGAELAGWLGAESTAAVVRYTGGVRETLVWEELGGDELGGEPAAAFRDEGVYLITGGLGGLGLLFAREILSGTGGGRVVLTGRSALSEGIERQLAGLAGAGRVSYRQMDLGDAGEVNDVVRDVVAEYGGLHGILHCAGGIADNFLIRKSSGEFLSVLEPKVAGTLHLDVASRDVDLDFVVLFSSVAGALGNVGQADYAAANSFLDRFASYRNGLVASGARRGVTRSVNWPLWREGGMGLDDETRARLTEFTGIEPMRSMTGMDAFRRCLALPHDQMLVAEGDLRRMRRVLLGMQAPVAAPVAVAEGVAEGVAGSSSEVSLQESTEQYLRREFSELLHLAASRIDAQAPLEEYGIDSILAMKLTGRLEKTFGSLSKTLFFEYQTIAALSGYLILRHEARLRSLFHREAVAGARPAPSSSPAVKVSAAGSKPGRRRARRVGGEDAGPSAVSRAEQPIAIVGLSGRYPEADNLEAYWRNLRAGRDCIVEVPRDRWDWRAFYSADRTESGRHYSKWGGFLADVDKFDPLFFNISPREAELMDPQERLFLEQAWMAVEDAGYTRASLQTGGDVGVYVGLMYSEYQLLGAEASLRGRPLSLAGSAASIANRVSYVLNLHGPSMTLDTMCSSSLTAIHLACQDLKHGRTGVALAGGVNLSIHPNKYLLLSTGQFISSDGHCQSFGEGGDGYIPGEGVGVAVLKRLADAERDGDHIYGIVRGSGLTHGGKTNGYTVPNPQSQASAIGRALKEMGTDARHISYIEAHGTGTRLGDPIEIAALSRAFAEYTGETGFCLIGSAKSNIGHCESAAGIAGLTKVLLQMRAREIVASLHSSELNPHIDFASTPFVVNQELRSWDAPVIDGRSVPRLAGVSSFGAGGSNAHLVVEEYAAPGPVAEAQPGAVAVLLSARTAAQLRRRAEDLLEFVRGSAGTLDLHGLAYTLQVGREAMEHRLGLIVDTVEQMRERLEAYAAGGPDGSLDGSLAGQEGVYAGQVRRNREASLALFSTDPDLQQTVTRWLEQNRYARLLELWCQGLEVDWRLLAAWRGNSRPRRLSLPVYPFARERFWIDLPGKDLEPGAGSALHPLLHRNTSDLSEQRYSSVFTGAELFLADHRVSLNGHGQQKVLPAVAYLEMARAAVEQASPAGEHASGMCLELRHTVWARPVVVEGDSRQVSIALREREAGEIGYEIYSRPSAGLEEDGEEVVHCQGEAGWSARPSVPALRLEQLKEHLGPSAMDAAQVYAALDRLGLHYGPSHRGIVALYRGLERGSDQGSDHASDQVLAELRLPLQGKEYVLSPGLLDSALQAAVGLGAVTGLQLPFALETLRILHQGHDAGCGERMWAWVRASAGQHDRTASPRRLDIDLCDPQGNVCVQIEGLSTRAPAAVELDRPEAVKLHAMERVEEEWAGITQGTAMVLARRTRREIVLALRHTVLGSVVPEAGPLGKPTGIALTPPGLAGQAPADAGISRPRIRLSAEIAVPSMPSMPAAASVRLFDLGDGIFSVEPAAGSDSPSLIEGLLQALSAVRRQGTLKAVVIHGLERCKPRGRAACNQAVEQGLYKALVSFPCPLIAAVVGDMIGAGLLAALVCDLMVCSEQARYGYTDVEYQVYPTEAEARLLAQRLGSVLAQDLLYRSPQARTGGELRARGWTCPMVDSAQVEAYAEHLAAELAAKPQPSLELLKRHLSRDLVTAVEALERVEGVAFDAVTSAGELPPTRHIRWTAAADRVLVLRLGQAGLGEQVVELEELLSQVRRQEHYKALVLAGDFAVIAEGGHEAARQMERLLLDLEIPVVAALEGDASGAGWLVSQLCDACVYSRTGVYRYAGVSAGGNVSAAAVLFPYRLGQRAGREVLLTGGAYRGAELEREVGALLAEEPEQVLGAAIGLAAWWSQMPAAWLKAWKQENTKTLSRSLAEAAAAWVPEAGDLEHVPCYCGQDRGCECLLSDVSDSPRENTIAAAPLGPIELQTRVVTATVYPDGIVLVKMEDRHARNMFSDALVEELTAVLAHIGRIPECKVVVLTGYDSYFASGGTRESLLAIQAGTARFTDRRIFQAALDSSLPVIAAMQGHGIGAGWTLGLFADLAILSPESRYVSPYMNYGFTPGAGATWILGRTLGEDLGRESLFTGRQYTGRELEQRGMKLAVVPRAEVQAAALALARRIAVAPRSRLIALKLQWSGPLQVQLRRVCELELAMHAETFVGQSATLAQIEQSFLEGPSAMDEKPSAMHEKPSAVYEESLAVDAAVETSIYPEARDVQQAGDVQEDSDVLAALSAALRQMLANELQMQPGDIDEHAQFVDLGMDSISGVTWMRRINETYQTSIEATRVYSHPTLSQLSRYVRGEAEKQGTLPVSRVASAQPKPRSNAGQSGAGQASAQPVSQPMALRASAPQSSEKLLSHRGRGRGRGRAALVAPSAPATIPAASAPAPVPPPAAAKATAIAVIGMAGRFPQARNLEEFWNNIAQARDCIGQVPAGRWDADTYFQPGAAVPGKTNSRWAGMLEDYDQFDPLFFNISPTEAESMDPQQRLFLETCWHSIEDAGYDARALSGSRCGVFVGCAAGDYHQRSMSAQGFTGSAMSILAARISYFLNLQGPSIALDTACSSSLVAVAQACDNLVSGDVDLALAGGVYVMTGPGMHIMTAQAGMLSPEGRCFTFDQRADGFVPGEGVGVVMLKRLADAERDRDIIYGVLEGWGVNQDGRTNGITAPNPQSQTRLEQGVYDKYGIDPGSIQLVEAHGTGTRLGDPIEVEALKQSFAGYTHRQKFCALGSVKSNIGHCLTAAGIAGVIKLMLALKHRQLPPTAHFEQLNEHIALESSPFYINRELQEWKLDGAPRRLAAVSAFGFSGTNAFVVAGEYLPKPSAPVAEAQPGAVAVLLSARTAAQLRRRAEDLLEFVRGSAGTLDLHGLAYTLQVGREAMEHRLGLIVDTVEHMRERLEAYAAGGPDGSLAGQEGVYAGQVRRNREASLALFSTDPDLQQTVTRWLEQNRYARLLELWCQGLEVDWRLLAAWRGNSRPRRLSLPVYPFARERFWIDLPGKDLEPGAGSALHPLLHRNTSDLSEQRYSSVFTGAELFLADHRVSLNGHGQQKVLPAVAYLEMARAAVEQASPAGEHASGMCLELRHTVWARPVVVEGDSRQVSIALREREAGEIGYEIYSRPSAGLEEDGEEVVHCQGEAGWSARPSVPALRLEQLKEHLGPSAMDAAQVYAALDRLGLHYGPSHRGIVALYRGLERGSDQGSDHASDQVLAELRLPLQGKEYVLSPGLLDSALQAAVGLGAVTGLQLPFALETLRILHQGHDAGCGERMWAWVRASAGQHDRTASPRRLDIDLCDPQGNVCVQIEGLSTRAPAVSSLGTLFACPVWRPSSVGVGSGGYGEGHVERHVVLCAVDGVDLPDLESRLLSVRCVRLDAGAAASDDLAGRYSGYALSCFGYVRDVLLGRPGGPVLVQVVVGGEDAGVLSGLSGLLRTAGLENPLFHGQLVVAGSATTGAELAGWLGAESTAAVVRYTGGVRETLVWEELGGDELGGEPAAAFRDEGVYLITGGLGGLGLLFAREILSGTGGGRVVLTGRSALSEGIERQLAGLAGAGRVSYRQMDLGDAGEVNDVVRDVVAEYGGLHGILHCAGGIADNFLIRKSSGEFLSVLEPKVAGTLHLDVASRDVDLDFVVLFSSVAGALGNVGQADYAAANSFLDRFASYRNGLVASGARRGVTRSVNWPLWREGGMGLDDETRARLTEFTGIEPMRSMTGMDAFRRCLALPHDQMLVAEGDLRRMRRVLLGMQAPVAAPVAVAEGVAEGVAGSSSEVSLQESTEQYLRREFSELLHLSASRIDAQAPLEEYGIDSILAMKLTGRLEKTFGSLSKTLFFEYQTIAALSGYLILRHEARLRSLFHREAVAGARPAPSSSPAVKVSAAGSKPGRRRARRVGGEDAGPSAVSRAEQPIAIVGLSGRYPEADNLEAYWRNLRAGRDCIVEVPRDRWDWRAFYSADRTESGRHYSKWGGFLADVDKFDPLFFNISPREAELMDPQERLFLEQAWMAVEDAGYTRASLQTGGDVGVYVGLMYSEYQLLGAEASLRGRPLSLAGSAASIANRVSYVLNLHGPSMTLDTMCSSSLTAIHLACQDLKHGRTGLALAGGVNLSIHPNKYLLLSTGQFISSDGHCQSFGEGGDGYIPGEGVGVAVLKRLADAERDGDHIYGIVRGSGLTHGGKTNGYTVPNPQSQASAIGRALKEMGTDARHISYIEAHGTGTRLGDPIEIAALSRAFAEYTGETGFCLIGSAKSNIGHCESAAGIAGLTKVLLQMRAREIVASLHSSELNPHIDFASTPFVVNQELRSWDAPVIDGRSVPRLAGVSSFGAGGSNAHLVVEEYAAPGPVAEAQPGAVAVLLSARTAAQLRRRAEDLLEFVRGSAGTLDLHGLAYTLQVGREAMEHRLGLIVDTVEQMRERLEAYAAGGPDGSLAGQEGVYAGQVRRNREASLALFSTDPDLQQTVTRWLEQNRYARLLELWCQGLEVDWRLLAAWRGNSRPRRLSLPVYPFARERFWIDLPGKDLEPGAGSALHPLLHRNTSDLSEQRYSSVFTGAELFLADHRVSLNGHGQQKVLPAVAYLEMARAAVEQASPAGEHASGMCLELRHTVWARPVVVEGDSRQVSIALREREAGEIGYEIYSRPSAGLEEDGEEVVHCQGEAGWSARPSVPALRLEQLKEHLGPSAMDAAQVYAALDRLGLHYGPSHRGIVALYRGLERGSDQGSDHASDQVLAELRLPLQGKEYVLSPGLLDSALQAAVGLGAVTGLQLPFALETLRILHQGHDAGCGERMWAWVRASAGQHDRTASPRRLDIDLCDPQGNVCVQIEGLSTRAPAAVELDRPEAVKLHAMERVEEEWAGITQGTAMVLARRTRREIVLALRHTVLGSVVPEAGPLGKPTGIALTPPGLAGQAPADAGISRPRIRLSAEIAVPSMPSMPAAASVRLFDLGDGIFSVEPAAGSDSPSLIEGLLQALSAVRRQGTLKAVVIHGLERCKPRGRAACNQAVEQGLYKALVSFPCPLIAAVVGDMIGAGLLAALVCDLMVCSEQARYGYTDVEYQVYPTEAEARLLAQRLGSVLAQDLLYRSPQARTGGELRARGWTCPMVDSAQVEAYAEHLAAELAAKPQPSLELLKRHLSRDLVTAVEALERVEGVAFDAVTSAGELPPTRHIRWTAAADRVLVLRLGQAGLGEQVVELEELLSQVRRQEHYKALVLAGDFAVIAEGGHEAARQMERLLLDLEIPVVAALEGDASGAGWLVSQLCDACVYSRTGVYRYAGVSAGGNVSAAAVLFPYRLGQRAGREVLLTGGAYRGAELEREVGALLAEEPEQVLGAAIGLAAWWSQMPAAWLKAWKQENTKTLSRSLAEAAAAWVPEAGDLEHVPCYCGQDRGCECLLSDVSDSPRENTIAAAPLGPIELQTRVVTATVYPDGIVLVKMEDRHARNMFSDALVEELTAVLAHIGRIPECKVVVLTGYDSYFASGGTRESLLAIQAGTARFTDRRIFQAALDSSLPVIAAMQGHGIGAGWTLGLFADLAILSPESRYVSPYMNYGFTPGAGATWILGRTLGEDLGRESLFTGRQYTGRELEQRGMKLAVVPRAEVQAAALALARRIAVAPRSRLIALKLQWSGPLQVQLRRVCELELAMHAETFVGQSATLAQIEQSFLEGPSAMDEKPSAMHEKPSAVYEESLAVDAAVETSIYPEARDVQQAGDVQEDSDVLAALSAALRQMLANELQMQPGDIDEHAQFVDLGMDSISGVTWMRRINETYQTSIEATRVYSHPTLSQLSRYVRGEAEKQGTLPVSRVASAQPKPRSNAGQSGAGQASAQPVSQPMALRASAPQSSEKLLSHRGRGRGRGRAALVAPSAPATIPAASAPAPVPPPAAAKATAIAVIGMAGRFPQARNLEEFWNNIAQARDCIGQVPAGRWDADTYFQPGAAVPGKTNSRWAGMLEDYDQFDPLFFNISPTEAESMDPQQRLFLETCWHSIEDAGYDARALSGSRCGVFVGCAAGDYHQRSMSAQGFTGSAMSILAARISYFLNLQGPSIALDTACSSSLVAVAQACDNLVSGDVDLALAGGVYVMTGPGMHIMTAQAGMLSPEGRCFTFDQRADGFVPGEGVGVVMLKRLADAERDRDIIYGVLEGWGVNQDGRTNGITAPNPQSQTRLEQGVYDKYGIDPGSIQLVEAHGTGTRLGDPIEVEALKQSFAGYTHRQKFCALGSVKSNIGHCLTAAGIAGVIKLMLALKHRQLPPTAHFEQLNEHIALESSPFYINRELQEWKLDGAPRRLAAVSAFGFSGTNAFVVAGEYLPKPSAPVAEAQPGAVAVLLSARTAAQLRRRAEDLLEFVRGSAGTLDLHGLAYTLQVGREAMEHRLGLIVDTVEHMRERLEAYAAGGPDGSLAGQEGVYAGQVRRNREASLALFSTDPDLQQTVTRWLEQNRYARLLELWCQGLEVDWRLLAAWRGNSRPRRLSLPVYPFARERFWIDLPGKDLAEPAHTLSSKHGEAEAIDCLLALPVWKTLVPSSNAADTHYGERHLLLCELAGVDREQLKNLLPLNRCVWLEAGEEANLAERYSWYALECFTYLKKILLARPQARVLVQVMIGEVEGGEATLLVGLSALLRTASLENPLLSEQLVIVSASANAVELAGWLAESDASDSIVRYSGSTQQRLVWEELAAKTEQPLHAFRDDGVYLITGGLGELGLLFAREILYGTRKARIVLTGRSPLNQLQIESKRQMLNSLPGQVTYRQLDLNDAGQVSRLVADVVAEYGGLNGILHCAGMMADNSMVNKAQDEFLSVLQPKVAGTFHLDQASRGVKLDFVVLFSSVAAVIGNPGSADYAVANSFMDHFAAYRNRLAASGERDGMTRYGVTRSLNWPLWQEGGMGLDVEIRSRLAELTGMVPMKTQTGMDAFSRCLALPYDQLMVVEGLRSKLTTYYLQGASGHRPASQVKASSSLPSQHLSATGKHNTNGFYSESDVLSLAASHLRQSRVSVEQIRLELKRIVSDVLGIDPSIIDVFQAFVEFGLDSFLATGLVTSMNRHYGIDLPSSIVFDFPNVEELARRIGQELEMLPRAFMLAPPLPAVPVFGVRPEPERISARLTRESRDGRIAIIGMSGRYPQAENLGAFWNNLVEGKNSVVEVPPTRWNIEEYYDPDPGKKGKTNSRWLGALDNIDCFDPLFFRISPQEAEYIDPHHRIFLEESYKAFEDAGYAREDARKNRCGVYLGISSSEYAVLLAKNGTLSDSPVTSNHTAVAAARIAYYLNLKGPAISVDTACSSSLVAIHLACQGLRNHETDMALAGGVTLWLAPEPYLSMSQAGMLSSVGQCKAFDDAADGIVVGEGVGALLLKRLEDAERDNDLIHGVILGSGINQDGRTNGLTAPSLTSQIELEREIYERYQIDPDTITYVEAHGTGTRLGDPIELEALAAAFKQKTSRKNFCALGSVKSNIGHTTSAAGVASVQKVLLSMKHKTLVPSLGVTKENSRFDFRNSPFYISRERSAWNVDHYTLRRAAVSSFGFSGTNAHLVMEEYVHAAERTAPVSEHMPRIVPLSARTEEGLQQKARDLLEFLRTAQEPTHSDAPPRFPNLESIAYSLQTGREEMEMRVVFVTHSITQLEELLNTFVNGEKEIEGVYRGRVGLSNEDSLSIQDDIVVDQWMAWIELIKHLEFWTRGKSFDWNKLYGDRRPGRISLPAYPFARERYWVVKLPPLTAEERISAEFERVRAGCSIEEIFDKIGDETMDSDEAVQLLRVLV